VAAESLPWVGCALPSKIASGDISTPRRVALMNLCQLSHTALRNRHKHLSIKPYLCK
jgi:hypothetical protein